MSVNEFKIRDLLVSPNLLLAPMSGVTHSAFRRLIKRENKNAVGLLTTEFVSIEGLSRKNLRTERLLDFKEEERPISIQIFGFNIDRIVESAKMVEAVGADVLDFNCGCPVPKVVHKKAGSYLMKEPEHLEKILKSLVKAVNIPVTVKIRSGWDESSINAVEISKRAEDSGVSMIVVHGRTRMQRYTGEADIKVVQDVVKAVNIPVVGCGDIVSVKSANKYFDVGVSGIMIGRGALTNPWIFSEIYSARCNLDYKKKTPSSIAILLDKYYKMIKEDFAEKALLGFLKQIASRVTKGVRGAKMARHDLCVAQSIDEFFINLEKWKKIWESEFFLDD